MLGRERRFEDIDSGDEVDGVTPPFLTSSGTNSSVKRPRQSPSRKPRSTYHEKVGEGGFIFTIDASSSSSNPTASSSSSSSRTQQKIVPGSRGRPSSQASNGARSTFANVAKASLQQDDAEHRSPSAAKKTMRRSSLLKDGTSAIPHPHVPDDKLHRHCSGDLGAEERMKHLTVWTLERSRKELKRQSSSDVDGKLHFSLLNALKYTLEDINKGNLKIDWNSQGKGRAKSNNSTAKATNGTRAMLPPHPLNESNKKQESILKSTVKELQKQDKGRKQVEDDLEAFEKETERLRKQIEEGEEDGESEKRFTAIASDIWDDDWTLEDRTRLDQAARSIATSISKTVTETDTEQRATLATAAAAAAAARFLHDSGGETSCKNDQGGRETDLRWKDVEFNADLLRSKSHKLAQMSALSQRYIGAVSARGAKALKDMTSGSQSSSSRQTASSSHTTTSTISRESRENLERIISSLRSIEAERSVDEEDGDIHLHAAKQLMRQGIGDVSEGDLLRAYAELS